MKKTDINAFTLLERVRTEKPVIHHLTNWVTIYDCAQIVKTLGASPVMAHAAEEVAEMAAIASALVLNIGTLTPDFTEAMKKAAASANTKKIPVILDVCGAGATGLRDRSCADILANVRVDIIKGNVSEISRVAGGSARTRGVDAGEVHGDIEEIARGLARTEQCTVVVTGKTDIVTDGTVLFRVQNGTDMMTHVVGTGCMAASVIGTFAAVEKNHAVAAAAGLVCFEIAAELADECSDGPIEFKDKLFDRLFDLDRTTIEARQRVERADD